MTEQAILQTMRRRINDLARQYAWNRRDEPHITVPGGDFDSLKAALASRVSIFWEPAPRPPGDAPCLYFCGAWIIRGSHD